MASRPGLGAFLFEKRLLNHDDWMASIERQIRAQVPIGKLALKAGMLTIRQVQQVLRVSAGTNVRFGEVAVELGFLEMDQIGHLLTLQRDSRPPLAGILLEMGLVEEAALKEANESWGRKVV